MVISPSPSARCALVVNRRVAEQLSVPEISRSPEVCRDGSAPEEACERSPVASLPFLPALVVSSSSLLRPQPELDQAADGLRLKGVQEQAAAQIELLTAADAKLSAAIAEETDGWVTIS